MSGKPTPPRHEVIRMGIRFPFVRVANPVGERVGCGVALVAPSPLSRRLVGIALAFFVAGFWLGLIAHAVRGWFA
jgi:hypothetical protein